MRLPCIIAYDSSLFEMLVEELGSEFLSFGSGSEDEDLGVGGEDFLGLGIVSIVLGGLILVCFADRS